MKNYLIAFAAFCAGIACTLVFLNQKKSSPPAPAPLVGAAATQPVQETPLEKVAADKTPPPTASPSASEPVKASATMPPTGEVKPDDSASVVRKTVDALLAAKSAHEKHDLFQQLIKSGRMDAAIAELQQRATDNPGDAEIPTTLGEALINKVAAIHAAGGDMNEEGILAMQADQSFNAALKIDPQNFEAQLVKSISQTYWPADPARDAQVVQTLTGLIDRQESMAAQPDFAQTYLYLGNEYLKIGQPEKAAATWQLGLQKFPNDPALLKKNGGQP